MITLKDYFETVDFKITEGSRYMWTCYGPKAYRLDAWNGDHLGTNASIIFDTDTQTVYETTVYDYAKPAAYRMINPEYVAQYQQEAKQNSVEPNQAWDDVDYIDLDVIDDWTSKARAIMTGQAYDDKVTVPLDLSDDQTFELMKLAHEHDMSLNNFVEYMLQNFVDTVKLDNSGPAVINGNKKKRKSKVK